MLAIEEYESLRRIPSGRLVMYQRWRSLLFLHFSCDPQEVQRLLPKGLDVDTFDGKAWVGLVPFRMEGIRPRFLPGVPGNTAFPETNVRTYVHKDGKEPGVWFFSLDADNPLACRVARTLWRLPYHEASMALTEEPETRRYTCKRRQGNHESLIEVQLGEELKSALPGSLDFFLIERYLLYADRAGFLLKGRVHHPPYPLQAATVSKVDDSLVAAAGIEPRPIEHVLYSPGVDVRIYAIEPA
ncbi:MAG: YqjF family protein [Fimbriimonas sp.]